MKHEIVNADHGKFSLQVSPREMVVVMRAMKTERDFYKERITDFRSKLSAAETAGDISEAEMLRDYILELEDFLSIRQNVLDTFMAADTELFGADNSFYNS